MTHGQPARPANILNIVAINQGVLPLAMELPGARALGLEAAGRQVDSEGAVWVDIREPEDFAAGHIPGAINIQLSSEQFEQRVGWVVPEGAAVILVVREPGDAPKALHKLAFVGLENRVAGYLDGGPAAWAGSDRELSLLRQVEPQALHDLLQGGAGGVQVLDVREPDEWEGGHIAGARQRSYKDLPAELDALDLDRRRPVYVMCAGGYRSSTAGSLLMRGGFEQVVNLSGGMDAWEAAGLPVEE